MSLKYIILKQQQQLITLFGETFARETFASPKTREFFWINFRDLTNRRNFAR